MPNKLHLGMILLYTIYQNNNHVMLEAYTQRYTEPYPSGAASATRPRRPHPTLTPTAHHFSTNAPTTVDGADGSR